MRKVISFVLLVSWPIVLMAITDVKLFSWRYWVIVTGTQVVMAVYALLRLE